MKRARRIPPTYAYRYRPRDSDSSYPQSAAEVKGTSPPGSDDDLSRTTCGCVFTCICGSPVLGIMLFVNGIPKKIKCCNCGSLHKAEDHEIVTANFGNDCKHQVRTYDCEHHEFTCHDCHQVTPGTLKLGANGTNLPDGSPTSSSVGGVVGSSPPRRNENYG